MTTRDTDVPYTIALIGKSGSGKTTLALKLIAELVDRGLRVGSIKHHSRKDFEIDREGKDSWRMHEAGSSHVVIAAPSKVAHIRDIERELEFPEIAASMTDVDVVVAEGYRYAGAPALALFRADNPRTAGTMPDLSSEDIVAVVTDDDRTTAAARRRGLPVFGLDDAGPLCDFIMTAQSQRGL